MTRLRAAALVLLLCLASAAVQADELPLCVDSNDWAPFTFAQKEGSAQRLVREAAAAVGWQVRFYARPWRRCVAEVEAGVLAGMVGQAATQQAIGQLAFPLNGADVDPRRAVASTSMVLVRARGSAVQWDGQRVSGLQGGALYVLGYDDVEERLRALGLPGDAGGATNEVNARKLLAGRGNLMVTYQHDAQRLLEQPEFRGRLEVLSPPLGENHYYVAFGPAFYAAHRQRVEALWQAVPCAADAEAQRPRPATCARPKAK